MGIAHRDLKPSNFLLDERLHLKLVDFGTAKFLKESIAEEEEVKRLDTDNGGAIDTIGTNLTTTPMRRGTMVGSEDYIAPEILAGEQSGAPADLWSFGVILYMLLSGESPFKGHTEFQTFQNITNVAYQFSEREPNFTPEAKDLISRLLVKEPAMRFGISGS